MYEVRQAKNKRTAIVVLLIALAMFGFGFAMVPLYNTLCKVLGIDETSLREADTFNSDTLFVDKSRVINMEFTAHNHGNIRWHFQPVAHKLRVYPGEVKQITYFAKNNEGRTMTVQAIPSITPAFAAKYFKKVACFCFEKQTLEKGRSKDLPLLFYIDPKLPKDIKTISLSYTLFDVTKTEEKS